MEAIEKIKAEIERIANESYNSILPDEPKYRTHYKVGKRDACEEILSLISSLEKEQNVDNAHPSAVKSRFLSSDKEWKIIKEMYKDRFDDITPNRIKYLTFLRQVELDGRFSELNDLLKKYGK